MTQEEVLKDIQEHPENHRHTHQELMQCCRIAGILDASLVEAHAEHVDIGNNGGTKCDVIEGPCSCGAWHKKGKK